MLHTVIDKQDEDPDASYFFSALRIIGQLADSYLICEGKEGIICIDQHAAHERVVFEKLKKQRALDCISSQQFLFPQQVELDYSFNEIMKELKEPLNNLGFEIEFYGGNTWNIRSVPEGLTNIDCHKLLRDILEETATMIKSSMIASLEDEILKLVACRASVTVNMTLKEEEIRALLHDLDLYGRAGRCPHGRPFYRIISLKEVRRMFGRQ